MKTTLVIDDQIMRRLKMEAARRRSTLSELVEAALRSMLDSSSSAPRPLPPLPVYDLGGANVDLADRDALYRLMEEGD